MYLSESLSGLCLWESIKGESDYTEPILPSEEEMESNSRSKSAKLRIFERA